MVNLPYEMPKHGFRYLKVGYYAILHGTYGLNFFRSPAQHHFGLSTQGQNLVGSLFIPPYGHDGGLVQHNPFTFHINQGVGCPEINGHIL